MLFWILNGCVNLQQSFYLQDTWLVIMQYHYMTRVLIIMNFKILWTGCFFFPTSQTFICREATFYCHNWYFSMSFSQKNVLILSRLNQVGKKLKISDLSLYKCAVCSLWVETSIKRYVITLRKQTLRSLLGWLWDHDTL